MKKRSKSTWLTVYSGSKLSPFPPILADGSSYTAISVLRFEVGCPFPRCLWFNSSRYVIVERPILSGLIPESLNYHTITKCMYMYRWTIAAHLTVVRTVPIIIMWRYISTCQLSPC